MEPRRERKVVTVLFADLVGFTSRSEELDPEDVDAILSRYHGRLRNELERFGGTVEKFIGDAVMALFGAPVAHEDDPERAVRAALAIRDAFAEEGELELRIAVNTGEALVTVGARPTEGQGMAAGDVVNTTARLQAAAPRNGILVGETTYRATRDAIEYREAEPVAAKGKAQPVAVWEAVQPRSRVEVELQRPRAPLFGRRRELDTLADALARVREERSSHLVTLVGAPGLGKSRLVYELYRIVDEDPELIWWRQGRSPPYGAGVSFWALGEMVKAHAGILESDDGDTAAQKLRAAVDGFEDATWLEAHLRPLAGLAPEPGAAGQSRDEAFAAWRRFFEELADKGPLVLVFEDLHWADDGVLDFVDYLVDWASGVPILVVCSARPELLERRPDWGGGKRNAAVVSVAPLTDTETARLVAALLDRAVLPSETQADLLARADGNPLYAEEYVRLLQEGRTPDELPESVQGIIAARLDGLLPEEKSLVQDAAVIGRVFWLNALCAVAGGMSADYEQRLHALERKEFVRRERRSSIEGDHEFAFVHALVREVAYGQIPRFDRSVKHAAAAEWIESLARAEDTAEMLAHHYLAALEYGRAAGTDTGALVERARVALGDAGDRALSLNAFDAATGFYDAALELFPDGDEARQELLLKKAHAAPQAGTTELAAIFEELRAAGDAERAAEVGAFYARALWSIAQVDRAAATAREALALVEEGRASRARVVALGELARQLALGGSGAEAVETANAAYELARELGLADLEVHALNTRGLARTAATGDPEGLRDVEESLALAEERRLLTGLIRGHTNLASLNWSLGNIERARELHLAGLELSQQYGVEYSVRWYRAELLWYDHQDGRWENACAECDALLAEDEAGSPHYMSIAVRGVRAMIRASRGDAAGGLDDAQRQLAAARSVNDPQVLHRALSVGAFVLAECGHLDEARAMAAETVDVWRRDPDRTLIDAAPLAFACIAAGLQRPFLEAAAAVVYPTAWHRVTCVLVEGRYAEAADRFAELYASECEAHARLLAAENGDVDQLQRALAFYRAAGATLYVRRAERLLAASA